MDDKDFEAWWERFTLAPSFNLADLAKKAWLAGHAKALNPADRPVPEQIALTILKGEHNHLGPLVDYLTENGLLPGLIDTFVAATLSKMHAALVVAEKALSQNLAHYRERTVVRRALSLPETPPGVEEQYGDG